jgi:hypothetical protein
MSKRPTCDTPGCGRPIPEGGEGCPEICPTCLAQLTRDDDVKAEAVRGYRDHLLKVAEKALKHRKKAETDGAARAEKAIAFLRTLQRYQDGGDVVAMMELRFGIGR